MHMILLSKKPRSIPALNFFVFSHCKYGFGSPPGCNPRTPWYKPIFDKNCNTSGCHDGAHAPNLLPKVSYNELINGGFVNIVIPDQSTIYKVLNSGSMPPTGKLPPDEIQMVLDWIKLGAPNN